MDDLIGAQHDGDRPQPPHDLSRRTSDRAGRVLAGEGRGPWRMLAFAGPAVVASVAYVDPGNFATNIQAGSGYGYGLLWVVLLANLVAMLFQGLSARLGIVTGHSLPELCRDHFPPPVVWAMWIGSEVAAIATDLAEFLGGAIGFSLLFGFPLLWGMVLTGIAVYALLALQGGGFRSMEIGIGAMVALIGASYLVELFVAPIRWGAAAYHAVVPSLADRGALTLAVGIVGATVMPHAIYLHSSLTQRRVRPRTPAERARLLRLSDREVMVALGFAGLVNMAMVAMAAAAFHDGTHNGIASIDTAYRTLAPLLGRAAAIPFLLALIASGLSSSVVGTMAGQVIMQGFVRFTIPIWVRRLVTMLPAFAVVMAGVDATRALVLSQVVLSLVLPAPIIALLLLMRRPAIMGVHALRPAVLALALAAAVLILALNAVLIWQTLAR